MLIRHQHAYILFSEYAFRIKSKTVQTEKKAKKIYAAEELNNKFHGLKTGKIYKLSLRENILQIFLTSISDKKNKSFPILCIVYRMLLYTTYLDFTIVLCWIHTRG